MVKHSLPEFEPAVPAAQWHLSQEGRMRCEGLAKRLGSFVGLPGGPLYVSSEPKAIETAQETARRLGVSYQVVDGLHEHVRPAADFTDLHTFEERVQEFFARPGALVFGAETADQAHERFSRAVGGICEGIVDDTRVIVAHGTVISLYVSRLCGVEAFPLWKRLGLPSFVVLSMPDLRLLEVVERGWEG